MNNKRNVRHWGRTVQHDYTFLPTNDVLWKVTLIGIQIVSSFINKDSKILTFYVIIPSS